MSDGSVGDARGGVYKRGRKGGGMDLDSGSSFSILTEIIIIKIF